MRLLLYWWKERDTQKGCRYHRDSSSSSSEAMGGHSRVNATLNKISNYYYWNGMKDDIQEYVSSWNTIGSYVVITE